MREIASRPAVQSVWQITVLAALFPAFLFFSSCQAPSPPQKTPAAPRTKTVLGAPAPDITVSGQEGHLLKLSDLKGSVVLINFWATWCSSCDMENPGLHRLYERLGKYPKFRLLSVLYGDSRQAADAYLRRRGYDWPVYTDPDGRAAAAYGLTGVPESYLVDKNGNLQGKAIGPENWGAPEVAAFIEKLLKQ